MAKEKKDPLAPNQAGEWKCPDCKELTVCACVGHDENRKPIIRCMDCEKDFVDGKEVVNADNPR